MKKQLIKFCRRRLRKFVDTRQMSESYGLTEAECKQLLEIGKKYLIEELEEKHPNNKHRYDTLTF